MVSPFSNIDEEKEYLGGLRQRKGQKPRLDVGYPRPACQATYR